MELLVLNGHPEPDGLCAELSAAYLASAQEHASVRSIALRDLRFDPVLRRHHATQPLEPDLAETVEALLAARHVTWIFPCWWSATPALVKGFVDRVFTAGFAFRYRARHQQPERLLRGRSGRVISSMDSPRLWYHLVQGRPLHRAFVRGTLDFVGFAPAGLQPGVRGALPHSSAARTRRGERTPGCGPGCAAGGSPKPACGTRPDTRLALHELTLMTENPMEQPLKPQTSG